VPEDRGRCHRGGAAGSKELVDDAIEGCESVSSVCAMRRSNGLDSTRCLACLGNFDCLPLHLQLPPGTGFCAPETPASEWPLSRRTPVSETADEIKVPPIQGQLARLQERGASLGLPGGAGRIRTSNQSVMRVRKDSNFQPPRFVVGYQICSAADRWADLQIVLFLSGRSRNHYGSH
jgi:hypothetical protein